MTNYIIEIIAELAEKIKESQASIKESNNTLEQA